MAGRGGGKGASGGKFKLSKDFGPPKLRKVHDELVSRINQITPIQGLGTRVDQREDGRQISADHPGVPNADDTGSGGGGSGTPVNLYGALNGAPATYHLLQSSPPTPA